MTPTSIIIAALSIMTGSPNQLELEKVLGNNQAEIISQVQHLEGTKLSMIKETIDILAKYNLDIQTGNTMLANNSESAGVSYSTDPEETIITGVDRI
jgi:hypothetical protein